MGRYGKDDPFRAFREAAMMARDEFVRAMGEQIAENRARAWEAHREAKDCAAGMRDHGRDEAREFSDDVRNDAQVRAQRAAHRAAQAAARAQRVAERLERRMERARMRVETLAEEARMAAEEAADAAAAQDDVDLTLGDDAEIDRDHSQADDDAEGGKSSPNRKPRRKKE
ncbi:hypothetical protein WJT74_04705 [Sphingomicrobium sp. XHP0239]|uniref:hypothetical protein n=1 Tax=Sphingomicrobium maritimum TaxID=3133972 RepID=UPI0031CCAFB5